MRATRSERICVLHLGSPIGLYGAERWILALVKNLPVDRVESSVAVIKDAPELGAPLCKEAAQLGLRTHIFEASGRMSLRAVAQIRRYIRENRIQILHTHGYKSDLIGCLAVRGTQCKTVATPHGWCASTSLKVRLYEALDRMSFVFADAVAPLSVELCEGLRRVPGLWRKLHLIENGVDLAEIERPSELPEPLRGWRAAGTVVVGYIGRLIHLKHVETLIYAFERLDVPRKQLCIVGEGPQRAELEDLVKSLGESERVTFFGYREDRIALLKGFDVFVLPSESEGVPRCVMEAMAAGIPAVVSDIRGCRNVVKDQVTGLLFSPGDAAGLAECLKRILADSDLRHSISLRGQAFVRDRLSARLMAEQYVKLYESLVSSSEMPRLIAE